MGEIEFILMQVLSPMISPDGLQAMPFGLIGLKEAEHDEKSNIQQEDHGEDTVCP